MQGDERARETAIDYFLDEMMLLFKPRLIRCVDDQLLCDVFEDWLKYHAEFDQDERLEALIAGTQLIPVPLVMYRLLSAEKRAELRCRRRTEGNIVSLFGSPPDD